MQSDTVYERDVTVVLRDDTKLRADVFRPDTDDKVPALLVWSPYGKTGTGFFHLDIVPGRVGVQRDRLSGFEKFEGPDPAEWVGRGYGVVNIDTRGTFDSEGDIRCELPAHIWTHISISLFSVVGGGGLQKEETATMLSKRSQSCPGATAKSQWSATLG